MADKVITLPPRPLFDREPFNLDFIPYEDTEPGYLYYGEGGNIGGLAVSMVKDGALSFTGIYSRDGALSLRTEKPAERDRNDLIFRPLKQMMPAPDLTGKYLLEWIHRMSQSHTRRLIEETLNLCEEAKRDPAYDEYLDFLKKSLGALDGPLLS